MTQVRGEPRQSKRCKCWKGPPGCHRCRPSVDYQLRVRRSTDYWREVQKEIGTLQAKGPLLWLFGWCEHGFLGLEAGGDFMLSFCRHVQSQVNKLWADRKLCGADLPGQPWIVRPARRVNG